jgi:UTP--glucose-1-phosphate uridylyltransferase
MLPLGRKPVVQHVVEEVVASGIDRIIFVVSHRKDAINHHFTANELLEEYLAGIGKGTEVDELRAISRLASFTFVYTQPPYGNGAVLRAVRPYLEGSPFVLVWSDEIILSRQGHRIRQCLDAFEQEGLPVISAVEIGNPLRRSKYGMAELRDFHGDPSVKEIVRIVEKPALGSEPSSFATHGAYILPPEIFRALDETPPDERGEYVITDILARLTAYTPILAKIIPEALYLDCGNPDDYLMSQIAYAMHSGTNVDGIRQLCTTPK